MYIYKWRVLADGEESTGITCAENYTTAMEKLMVYWGEEADEYTLGLIAEDTLSLSEKGIKIIQDSMVW